MPARVTGHIYITVITTDCRWGDYSESNRSQDDHNILCCHYTITTIWCVWSDSNRHTVYSHRQRSQRCASCRNWATDAYLYQALRTTYCIYIMHRTQYMADGVGVEPTSLGLEPSIINPLYEPPMVDGRSEGIFPRR